MPHNCPRAIQGDWGLYPPAHISPWLGTSLEELIAPHFWAVCLLFKKLLLKKKKKILQTEKKSHDDAWEGNWQLSGTGPTLQVSLDGLWDDRVGIHQLRSLLIKETWLKKHGEDRISTTALAQRDFPNDSFSSTLIRRQIFLYHHHPREWQSPFLMHGDYRHLGILLVAHLLKTGPCETEEGSRQSLIINNKLHFHPNA